MANRSPPAATESAPTRVGELLARWQQSLDLHHKYLALDDAHYWHVQPWPKHERPAPWIVQLARQKLAALQAILERQPSRAGDELATALEHMQFLANLVGLQSVERHIPLAESHHERVEALRGASAPPVDSEALAAAAPATRAEEHTRELPRPRVARSTRPPANRASVHSNGAIRGTPPTGPRAAPPLDAAPGARELQVMQDAARLLQWGRKWHELGELISRMAERPNLTDVRRILRSHRPRIEALAARPN